MGSELIQANYEELVAVAARLGRQAGDQEVGVEIFGFCVLQWPIEMELAVE